MGKYQSWLNLVVSQDTLGGGFDATQAFVGDLANFHIWDRKLSVGEIYNLATCSSKAQVGNVFAWMETSLEIYGGASKWTFEACRQLNWTAGGRDRRSCWSHLFHTASANSFWKVKRWWRYFEHHFWTSGRFFCSTTHLCGRQDSGNGHFGILWCFESTPLWRARMFRDQIDNTAWKGQGRFQMSHNSTTWTDFFLWRLPGNFTVKKDKMDIFNRKLFLWQ